MNILRLIFDNLRRGTVSSPLPHKHQCTSSQYRGLIRNDETRCIGCSACAYACPTAAIEVTRSGDTYSWAYDPGKCTFCGRCIERCKPNTLTMLSELPPLYAHQGDLSTVLNMVRKKPAPRPAAAATATRPAVPAEPAPATKVEAAAATPAEQPAS